MIFTSRSRIVSYLNCERYGYLSYDWEGTGLESVALGLPLANGIVVHDTVAPILLGESLDGVVHRELVKYREAVRMRGVLNEPDVERNFLVQEQCAMLEGMIRAWFMVRYPRLKAEYDLIAVERELNWPLAEDIIDQVRCDVLARRKSDGGLFYIEWKTTSGGGDEWAKQWEHNTQVLANTLAVEEMLGERVEGVLIEGIAKGKRAMDTNPRSPFFERRVQQSPLCYGYEDVMTKELQVGYTAAKGWQKVASWQTCSMTEWLEKAMDEADLFKLFSPVPPIRPRPDQLERWRRQTVHRERERQGKLEAVVAGKLSLDEAFPMNDEHCFRYWGHPCAFEPLCFGGRISEDPIGSGLYQARISHHGPKEIGS